MAQADKSRLYQTLKSAGYTFTKHFREYTVAELEAIHQNIAARISEQTGVPVQEKNESEQPSQRLGGFKGPIRTDMQGRVWYQEEIIKSSIAKPRGYRVYREIGSNTKQVTVDSGDGYTERIRGVLALVSRCSEDGGGAQADAHRLRDSRVPHWRSNREVAATHERSGSGDHGPRCGGQRAALSPAFGATCRHA